MPTTDSLTSPAPTAPLGITEPERPSLLAATLGIAAGVAAGVGLGYALKSALEKRDQAARLAALQAAGGANLTARINDIISATAGAAGVPNPAATANPVAAVQSVNDIFNLAKAQADAVAAYLPK